MKLEICTNSFASAQIAMSCGVDRIELCQNLELGGTTPSAADIQLAVRLKEKFNCEVYVLIRPRTGDFCYSDEEFAVMKEDISFCKKNQVDGLVFGALTDDWQIDFNRLKKLIGGAQGMGMTFHRAFDLVQNTEQAIDQIIDLGFDRILTSGQQNSAFLGKEAIRSFVEYTKERISIMPGSGINKENVVDLINYTGVKEIHFSGREVIQRKTNESSEDLFEMNYWQTSEVRVKEMKNLLGRIN